MRSQVMAFLVLTAGLGCRIPSYVIEENVTVPPEVQQAFSPSNPGFVMIRNRLLGVLCAARGDAVVFHQRGLQDHETCEENRDNQDELSGTAYAVRPSQDELQRLDARTQKILTCGETAAVEDKDARTDVSLLNYHDNLWPDRKIAEGSSKGECVSSSRYVVNITLALKK